MTVRERIKRVELEYKRDYRKIKAPYTKHPRVVWRWFHWSKWPHRYILYWDTDMLEMRYKDLR